MIPVKTLVVDDSITIRALLERVLGAEPRIQLVGSARSAEEALEIMEVTIVQVITLDVTMPGMGGLGMLDALRERKSLAAAIMLSGNTARGNPLVETAFEKGAVACFDKTRTMHDAPKLIALIIEAANGRISRGRHSEEATSLPPTA